MSRLDLLFTALRCKVYRLVAMYIHDAKSVRIDTRVLFDLLGQSFFRGHFKLPSRLFTTDTRTPCFHYMLDTNEVGASLHIFR